MAIMLAVDVLGCTGTNEERAGLLHKIIQIAAELKSTMGNMFGFAAVMRALELPQVNTQQQHKLWDGKKKKTQRYITHTYSAVLVFVCQVTRLEHTWMALRQRHTEGAILYEKTLRPFMKSLNDGRGNGRQHTPHTR